MIGQSGCFGGGLSSYERIDTVEDASTVVDGLQQTAGTSGDNGINEEYLLTVQSLTNVAQEYAKRIRLLTYAVVAVVIYLVLKETV